MARIAAMPHVDDVDSSRPRSGVDWARMAANCVTILAIVYAVFAGLRTVSDMDLGWQLATGRWIAEHHAIPRTDVLSYTAAGHEWIYPVLSQYVLYLVWLAGGYALLSWLGAALTAATTALLLNRRSLAAGILAVIAVPAIAQRMAPRAEMFTQVLFALFVAVLWKYYKSGEGKLWVLPVSMAAWVNLHPGFVAGLAMCAAYVVLELSEFFWEQRRSESIARLRRIAPYLALTAVATLLNPWGPRIYTALIRQQQAMELHSRFIVEWMPMKLNAATLAQALDVRDPRSGLLWLIVAAVAAVVVAIVLRRFGAAAVLAASIYVVLHAIRLQAPFAAIVVVIGGSMFSEFAARRAHDVRANLRTLRAAVVVGVVLFVGVRVADLVTNRTYLRTPGHFSEFGAGPATWLPERATAFIEREQLPANIFNEYGLGGYLAWKLTPRLPDYIDGRAVPFGGKMFVDSMRFASEPPDSADFAHEVEARNINTIVLSLNYELGVSWQRLNSLCSSDRWKPVYFDTKTAVFVQNLPKNEALLSRLSVHCGTFDFLAAVPENAKPAQVAKDYTSAALTLVVLGRSQEAWTAIERAGAYSKDSYAYHFVRGVLLREAGRLDEAEAELNAAVDAGFDGAALPLYNQYVSEGRFDKAVELLKRARQISTSAFLIDKELGMTYLKMGQPALALEAFDQAERENPMTGEAAAAAGTFSEDLARGRAEAQAMLGTH